MVNPLQRKTVPRGHLSARLSKSPSFLQPLILSEATWSFKQEILRQEPLFKDFTSIRRIVPFFTEELH